MDTTNERNPMTRRHYTALAAVITNIKDPAERKAIAERAADSMGKTFNANFDRDKFLQACGV